MLLPPEIQLARLAEICAPQYMAQSNKKTDRIWKLQDAKNRFSEFVEVARAEGPQTVSKHGQSAVVVVAEELFRKLAEKKNPVSFAEFIRRSPLKGVTLDLKRHGAF